MKWGAFIKNCFYIELASLVLAGLFGLGVGIYFHVSYGSDAMYELQKLLPGEYFLLNE